MLPWMDVLFGTYHMPRTKWPSKYGIDTAIPSGLMAQVLEPLMPPVRRIDHLPSSGALPDSHADPIVG